MSDETYRAVRAATKPLREQRDCWKQAAVGLLVLSIMCNVVLFIIHFDEQNRWQETEESLRADLLHAEAVRDHAVKELGELANQTALEAQARREQAEYYETLGAYQYIGECTITAYCPCAECCSCWADGLTATGLPAGPGIVAVDPDVIPLGSTVVIDGQRYLAADTGSVVEGLHIDVCTASHEEAKKFGVRKESVWVAD